MKKILLTLTCATAMVASAQVERINDAASGKGSFAKVALVKKASVLQTDQSSKAPLKSKAEGVYYKTPAGSMWLAVPQPFYAYDSPYCVVAPWTDFTYVNMSDKKNGTWGLQAAESFVDLTEDADENNNLPYAYNGGIGNYYAPQYTESGVTYIPTHTLPNGSKETMVNSVDDIALHTFHPMNVDGAGIYGMGVLDNENLYGAGKYKGIAMAGIQACYPKPMSPLYVEYASAYGRVAAGEALSGKTLTMNIFNLEDEDAEPIVLTCTENDLVLDSEEKGTKYYMVNFTKKVRDEISGDIVADPFVIDFPSLVIISGFDQEGVNLGLGGYAVADEFLSDNAAENISLLLYFDTENKVKSLNYENIVVALGFQSMFDVCSVETELTATDGNKYEANGIAVSDDGQTFGNNAFKGIDGVRVCTAFDWTDEETGEEKYWSDDMYDYEWIQNLVVKPLLNSINKKIGYQEVGAVCDPLPAGTDKRYAVIHLNGRGVTSEDIYVLQGNITLEEAKADHAVTAITDVKNDAAKKNNKKFNLAGQQVDNNFKGIVISNGKKAIMK